ncbi:hypothetical protein BB559_001732 [Furculomyces boomerangus]|uniref:Uncharacterized protein n=1 Tax=Furculomyces boomerangus TaxID=61424 RepID=A0A2T9Z0T2_9FUNG|nr:hypothetical protein BB559_001732 [Furculomyces boomerangus]
MKTSKGNKKSALVNIIKRITTFSHLHSSLSNLSIQNNQKISDRNSKSYASDKLYMGTVSLDYKHVQKLFNSPDYVSKALQLYNLGVSLGNVIENPSATKYFVHLVKLSVEYFQYSNDEKKGKKNLPSKHSYTTDNLNSSDKLPNHKTSKVPERRATISHGNKLRNIFISNACALHELYKKQLSFFATPSYYFPQSTSLSLNIPICTKKYNFSERKLVSHGCKDFEVLCPEACVFELSPQKQISHDTPEKNLNMLTKDSKLLTINKGTGGYNFMVVFDTFCQVAIAACEKLITGFKVITITHQEHSIFNGLSKIDNMFKSIIVDIQNDLNKIAQESIKNSLKSLENILLLSNEYINLGSNFVINDDIKDAFFNLSQNIENKSLTANRIQKELHTDTESHESLKLSKKSFSSISSNNNTVSTKSLNELSISDNNFDYVSRKNINKNERPFNCESEVNSIETNNSVGTELIKI